LKETLNFHSWLLTPKTTEEGRFELPLTNGTEQTTKKLIFKKAHCINLHESYSASDSSQMYMRITMVASIIKFGLGVVFFQSTIEKPERDAEKKEF
jgi:hypothetical protein